MEISLEDLYKIEGDNSFYKLTNGLEMHNGMYYKTGLNIDRLPFNPTGRCSPGGMYFFSKCQLQNYMYYVKNPVFIRKVVFEDSNGIPLRNLRIYKEKNKYKANKFILDERYVFLGIDHFSINMHPSSYINIIKRDCLLRDVPSSVRTYEICLEAVRNYGLSIEWVPADIMTYELCLEAVKQNGLALKYIPFEFCNNELYIFALRNNGFALKYIPHEFKTRDMCDIAVKYSGWNFMHVPDGFRDIDFYSEICKRDDKILDYLPIHCREIVFKRITI